MVRLIALGFSAVPGRAANAASRAYLARVLGRPARFADVHRHTLTFAQVAKDRIHLLAEGAHDYAVTTTGETWVDDCVHSGRGGVLLGAHFGSFEVLRALEPGLPGLRVRYLMYGENARTSHALLATLNPEIARRVVPLSEGPDAMLGVVDALGRGDVVAFLGDRLPDPKVRAQLRVPFLGGTIALPTSPYVVAMAARVPLILCFAPRLGANHYAAAFELLHDGTPVPRANREAMCRALAARYAAALEDLCRRHPYNWFNFFDIWADGEPLHGAAAPERRGGTRSEAAGRA